MDSSKEKITEWYPIRQFLNYPGYDFALVILNQPIIDECLFKDIWSIAKTCVAADGGANHVYDLNRKSLTKEGQNPSSAGDYVNLNTIIGDLDSLSDEAKTFFTTKPANCTIIHDPDQYSTDFTKAVRLVRKDFPGKDIVCMGGLGGRVDQGLSQIHHLYLFQTSPTYADGKMFLLSGESLSFLLKAGKHCIHVREPNIAVTNFARMSGDPFAKYVGIIPVKEPSVITTKGLEWDVEDWPTEFGGQMSTSNHVLPETEVVEIKTTKDVLFTIALKQMTKMS
ncbi:thiamine pyrophosphokinase [Annulohypoxylon maeteangense]|uniref:thiamine pyrophosphokinase n=1 Tax=Annulohypoxylon maeteangense TaxID=1927788 RepID=UPI002007779F|nr:thiamine pyrophosphokinase [Annulohypoxylon maeteangense]KAI0880598.1 thiamine pyrophosphokinase [Annulohypoxylon maeteangense]